MIAVGPNQYADRFYVYSVERAGDACWWKPFAAGYTANIAEAGLYTLDDVNAILAQSHGEDIPVPVSLIGIIAVIARDPVMFVGIAASLARDDLLPEKR